MCDNNPYHPHYTYTFETVPTPVPNNPTISTIARLKVNRPFLAPGVMKLYKEDLKTNYFGCKKYLRLEHPYTLGKTGFVVFSFHDMPDSQDTKTTFSSFVILENTGIMNCSEILKTCKVPFLMYLNSDGYLSDYSGGINSVQLKNYLAMSQL